MTSPVQLLHLAASSLKFSATFQPTQSFQKTLWLVSKGEGFFFPQHCSIYQRSRMVCNSLLTKDENLPYAEGNQEKELRFHRILRENKDSEPVGFQQIDLEDSDTFQMSKRQRATQGTWNPIGKRTKVTQIQSSVCNMFLLKIFDSVLSRFFGLMTHCIACM